MDSKRTCQECGAPLPPNAPEGLCPKCLLGMGINQVSPDTPTSVSKPALENPPLPAGRGRFFGDYELLEEIARGGMGVVYKARQVSLNRTVAVKMLLFGQFSSEEFVKRFRTEAEAAASLQHPNIVPIHEIGQHDGQHYFSMDYVEGMDLAERIREKPLSAREAARYLKIIAEAIHYAHQRGVLHRDLKPSNVLLDQFDQPRVTDFGLAKRLSNSELGIRNPELTSVGQVLGSPNYMPPEQADSTRGKLGPASDVYSLGAVLYHLVTGRSPFLAETLEETLLQVLNLEPVAPRLLNPSIPRDLETICLKCLEKDPERRYASARALGEDLGCFLESRPIQARPASTPEKIWRWCRRNPAAAAVAALLVLAAASATVAAIVFNELRATATHSQEEARLRAYVADMSAALQNRKEGNAAQALALLRSQWPAHGQPDLRGFEWRYLWRLCHPKLARTLPVHNQVLGAMQFSPSSEFLATYCWDNTLRIWSLETQRPLLVLPGASFLGAFSNDGRSFLASTMSGSVVFYRLDPSKALLYKTNQGEVLACSADGKSVVTYDQAGLLSVRDADSETPKFSLPLAIRRHLDYGLSSPVRLSPDAKTLAAIDMSHDLSHLDPRIRLWDVRSGTELPPLPENRQIHSFEFSPDSRFLAVGDGAGLLEIWDLARREKKSVQAYDRPLSALAFTADGGRLATGSSAPLIKLWSVPECVLERALPGHIGQVHSLAFSADGKLLASGGRNAPVRMWNVGAEELRDESHELLADHWGNFTFSSDGKSMAAGCKDHSVKVWNVADFSLKARLPGASFAVAFTLDGKGLLTSTIDEIPQLWDLENKTSKAVPRYEGSMTKVASVDLSADRRLAALGRKDGSIQLFDLQSGKETANWKGHEGEVRSLAFSPDATRLVSGGRDRSVLLWDPHAGKLLGSNDEHRASICTVAYSRDGSTIVSGCGAGTIKFWDPATISKRSLGSSIAYHQDFIGALDFSPDGKTLASGSGDHTVKLWNIALRREVASFQLDGPIILVRFSPDGNSLAAVTDHGTLRLFRAATLAEAEAESKTE